MTAADRVRRSATRRLRAWAARRHGRDGLPVAVQSRRIYILPTRFGLMMGALVAAMLVAGLNYNSNLALAFAFLMASLAVVAMHHCHRNLLGLWVDAAGETDAFAGSPAELRFEIRNDSDIDRRDIEVGCRTAAGETAGAVQSAPPRSRMTLLAPLTVAHRGLVRIDEFELRSRHPFGWFRAWSYVHAPLTVYVAPRPQGTRSLPPTTAAPGAAAASEALGEEDFAGLRSYQPGMPLKHMAWKVLARGAEPAVRSYYAPGGAPECLDWFALEGLAPEARLSQLCRWVLEREAAGLAYALRLPGTELAAARGTGHRRACLRALAVVEAGG